MLRIYIVLLFSVSCYQNHSLLLAQSLNTELQQCIDSIYSDSTKHLSNHDTCNWNFTEEEKRMDWMRLIQYNNQIKELSDLLLNKHNGKELIIYQFFQSNLSFMVLTLLSNPSIRIFNESRDIVFI